LSNIDANMRLTASEIASFKQNGFVGPFPLYTPEDAVRRWNQAKLEMVLSKNKPHNSTVINYDRHLDCNTLSEHVAQPEIVSKLRSLMGDDILCWKTNLFLILPDSLRLRTELEGVSVTLGSELAGFLRFEKFVAERLPCAPRSSGLRR
jgi:hypothetical protein